VLVSEGATMTKHEDMLFEGEETDQYGHKKLGGIGDSVAEELKRLSPKYNNGRRINVVSQRLGYLVRCGNPDALDSIVPMAFGNLALDLILSGASGRLVCLKNGSYDNVPVDVVIGKKKVVNVEKFYNTERLRPYYHSFNKNPMLIMTSDS
jgi:6-phosphofructokinase 1